MGLFKGGFLRLSQTLLYALAFCCAGIILGIYSYFLSVLADRDLPIAGWKKAVEGLSGVAVVYTIFAVVLTCCLAGISIFSFIALVFDVLFIGAFIALAILTRHGASSCTGNVNTPLGSGPSDSQSTGYGSNGFGFGSGENATYAPNLHLACRLNTAAFAVSLIGAFIFLLTALMQIVLARNHKKEKRYGPSPANNYTSGSAKKRPFWKKNKNANKDVELGAADAGAGGLAANHAADTRPSHDTAYTGSTMAGANNGYVKDAEPVPHTHGHGAYYTQPQGTGVNPYGYDNRPAGAAQNY